MSNEKERQTEKARKRVIEMIKEEEERNGKKKNRCYFMGVVAVYALANLPF